MYRAFVAYFWLFVVQNFGDTFCQFELIKFMRMPVQHSYSVFSNIRHNLDEQKAEKLVKIYRFYTDEESNGSNYSFLFLKCFYFVAVRFAWLKKKKKIIACYKYAAYFTSYFIIDFQSKCSVFWLGSNYIHPDSDAWYTGYYRRELRRWFYMIAYLGNGNSILVQWKDTTQV